METIVPLLLLLTLISFVEDNFLRQVRTFLMDNPVS